MTKIEDDIFDIKPTPFSSLSMKQRYLVRKIMREEQKQQRLNDREKEKEEEKNLREMIKEEKIELPKDKIEIPKFYYGGGYLHDYKKNDK
jgi:TRAP-type C4-dicarboxylate transport system substrate-binding protein